MRIFATKTYQSVRLALYCGAFDSQWVVRAVNVQDLSGLTLDTYLLGRSLRLANPVNTVLLQAASYMSFFVHHSAMCNYNLMLRFCYKWFDHNLIVQYCDSWGGRDGQVYGLRKCTMTYILPQRIKSFSIFNMKLRFYPVDYKSEWVQSTHSRVILTGQ